MGGTLHGGPGWLVECSLDSSPWSPAKISGVQLSPPKKLGDTPSIFNMEPENDGFQEELPFLGTSFQVPC